jgi:hypothetical protein
LLAALLAALLPAGLGLQAEKVIASVATLKTDEIGLIMFIC